MRARDPRVLKRRSIAESFRIAASYAAAPRPPKSLPEDSGHEGKPADPGARGRRVDTAMLSRGSIGAGTNKGKVAPAFANNVPLWHPQPIRGPLRDDLPACCGAEHVNSSRPPPVYLAPFAPAHGASEGRCRSFSRRFPDLP